MVGVPYDVGVRLLPWTNKEVFHLFGQLVRRIELVQFMQSVGVRSRLSSELVYKGGNNTDFLSSLFKLAGAKKGAAQDGTSSGMFFLLKLMEVLGNGICNCRLAGASLASQPEDGRAVRRDGIGPCDYIIQNLLARSFGAWFAGHCRLGPQVSAVDHLPSTNTVKLR